MFLTQIPRRSRKCVACERRFQAEDFYHSILLSEDEGELERKDYCNSCWGEKGQSFKSHWQGKVPVEKGDLKGDDPESRATRLEDLKESLSGDPDQIAPEAYLLALFLARKKVLIPRQEMEHQGHDVIVYEVAETEEMLMVPKLSIRELEKVVEKSHEPPVS